MDPLPVTVIIPRLGAEGPSSAPSRAPLGQHFTGTGRGAGDRRLLQRRDGGGCAAHAGARVIRHAVRPGAAPRATAHSARRRQNSLALLDSDDEWLPAPPRWPVAPSSPPRAPGRCSAALRTGRRRPVPSARRRRRDRRCAEPADVAVRSIVVTSGTLLRRDAVDAAGASRALFSIRTFDSLRCDCSGAGPLGTGQDPVWLSHPRGADLRQQRCPAGHRHHVLENYADRLVGRAAAAGGVGRRRRPPDAAQQPQRAATSRAARSGSWPSLRRRHGPARAGSKTPRAPRVPHRSFAVPRRGYRPSRRPIRAAAPRVGPHADGYTLTTPRGEANQPLGGARAPARRHAGLVTSRLRGRPSPRTACVCRAHQGLRPRGRCPSSSSSKCTAGTSGAARQGPPAAEEAGRAP